MKKILLLLSITSILYAQKGNGYIDEDSIVRLMPEFKAAKLILENREKELSDTMNIYLSFSENITYAFADCQLMAKTSNNMVDSVKLKECEQVYTSAMLKYEADAEKYQRYATLAYEKLSNQLYEDLYKALQEIINKFCIKQKIQFLTDKVSLLYCPKCKDYTEDLILFMRNK